MRTSVGTGPVRDTDLIRKMDLNNLPGWFGGPSPSMVNTGLYQTTGFGLNAVGAVSAIAGTLYAMPFVCSRKQTYTHIGLRYTGTLLTTSNVRMALYNDSPTKGVPATLLADAGSVSMANYGAYELPITQTLPVGLYWLMFVLNTTIGVMCSSSGFQMDTSFNIIGSYTRISSYATAFAPDDTVNSWSPNTGASPVMWLRN